MRAKEKIMGGAVVLLLAITFLPIQTACAGTITDAYKSLSNYVTSSRPYNYIVTSRPYNYVTTSRPYNYAVSSIGSIVKSASNLVGKSGYPGMGGITIFSAKRTLARPDLSKMFEANPDSENGRALVYRKMESRTEYTITDTKTNKSRNINKSVFDEMTKNLKPLNRASLY